MRKIKFRIWNPVGGEMLPVCDTPSNVFTNAAFYPVARPQALLPEEYGDPVVMQYTGFNIGEKEIYEGDVVSYDVPGVGLRFCAIVWSEQYAAFGTVQLLCPIVQISFTPFTDFGEPAEHLQNYYTHRGHVFQNEQWKESFESIITNTLQYEQLV